jgi:hypothetical protein
MEVIHVYAVAAHPAVVVLLDDMEVPGHQSLSVGGCRPWVVPKVPSDHPAGADAHRSTIGEPGPDESHDLQRTAARPPVTSVAG